MGRVRPPPSRSARPGESRAGLWALLVALAAAPALAQPSSARAAPEVVSDAAPAPPLVRSVHVRLLGSSLPGLEERARQLVSELAGQRLSRRAVRRTIERLFATGRCADVVVRSEDVEGGVRLTVEVVPKRTIGSVDVVGNAALKKEEVLALARLDRSAEYYPEKIDEVVRSVTEAYARRGYERARVEVREVGIEVASEQADGLKQDFERVRLDLRVAEGEPTRVAGITVAGNAGLPIADLTGALGLGLGDVLDRTRLEAGLETLRALFRERAFYRASVGEPAIEQTQDGAVLELPISAGPRYRIALEGNRSFRDEVLLQVIAYDGSEALDSGVTHRLARRLAEFYRFRGYHDARVRAQERVSHGGQRAVLEFAIDEGLPLVVQEVAFAGNQEIASDELRRILTEVVKDSAVAPSSELPALDDPLDLEGRTQPVPRAHPPAPAPTRVYVESAYREAAQAMEAEYRARGFLSARVRLAGVQVDLDQSTASVQFAIEEGPKALIREISVRGGPEAYDLEVLADDVGGAEGLTYTWSSAVGPAPVRFHPNGTPGARSSTATFSRAGTYVLAVSVNDPGGLTATSTVTVEVKPVLARLSVHPLALALAPGERAHFSVVGRDQFDAPMEQLPPISWESSGEGAFESDGVFQAGGASGPVTVIASAGEVAGTAVLVVSGSGPSRVAPRLVVQAAASIAGPREVALSVEANAPASAAPLRYTWSLSAGPGPVSFRENGTPAAKRTVARLSAAGRYRFLVTAEGDRGAVSSAVELTVEPRLSGVVVTPATAGVEAGRAHRFLAAPVDQFGAAMPVPTRVSWSVSGGGQIDPDGVFSAAPLPGGPFTVTARVGSASGSATVTVLDGAAPRIVQPARASPAIASGTSVALLDELRLELGAPLSYDEVEQARRALAHVLGRRGYLFATVDANPELSAGGTLARVEFRIDPGPRVRVGKVVSRGLERGEEEVLRSNLQVQEGEVLDPEALFDTQRNLLKLGLFRTVSVRLNAPEVAEPTKDVYVEVKERPWYSGEVGVGYFLAEGPRLVADLTFPGVRGSAIDVSARGKLSYIGLSQPVLAGLVKVDDLVGVELLGGRGNLAVQGGLPHGIGWRVDGIAERVHVPFRFTRFALIPGLSWSRSRFVLSLQYELENDRVKANQGTGQLLRTLAPTDEERLRFPEGIFTLSTLRLGPTLDLRDNATNPHRGFLLALAGEYTWHHFVQYERGESRPIHHLKLSATATTYVPLGPRWVLALSARGGNVLPLDADSVTIPVKRFFLGGASSMRGFREDGLLPADRRTDLAQEVGACRALINPAGCTPAAKALLSGQQLPSEGGEVFALGKAELRFPAYGAFDLGVFFEAGNLWLSPQNFNPLELRYVAGAGLRLGTPIGPLAFDFGVNLFPDQTVNEPAFQLHFNIGLF